MTSLFSWVKRLPLNTRWAFAFVVLVTLWMASSVVFPPAQHDDKKLSSQPPAATTVQVRLLSPEPYTRSLEIIGRTAPLQQVRLAAQTHGEITHLFADRGTRVHRGDKLLKIDMGTRLADLHAAKAQVKAAQALVTTTQNLLKEGFAAETTLADQEAALAAAQQQEATISEDIGHTTVSAPIDGVVEDRLVDAGDYVSIGTPLFSLVNRDTFLLVGYVAQQDQHSIQKGQTATATLANGQTVQGTVRFIATDADPETKTFRVDVEVDGSQYAIPTGMTATIHLPVEQTQAYRIAHSLIVLADDGRVGIMTVTNKNDQTRARFLPVSLLTDTPDGLWVTGLPEDESLHLITRGQAAVSDGSLVIVQKEGVSDER